MEQEKTVRSGGTWFTYHRRVAYHETDAMGVVHHSNHIKYFEEGRVAWLREKGLIEIHSPLGPYTFAVVDLDIQYSKPALFEDMLEVWVQGKMDGARIVFQYALWSDRAKSVLAHGKTTLVPLGQDLIPTRLPVAVRNLFNHEEWSQVWPPQSKP